MKKIINSKKKGFTLIELIIVIAIIAILAAIAVPNFIALRTKSANNADLQSCQTIKKAMEVLVADNTLPATVSTFDVSFDANSKGTAAIGGTPGTATTAQAGEITTAIANVRSPQGHDMTKVDLRAGTAEYHATTKATKYQIGIGADGAVTVETN